MPNEPAEPVTVQRVPSSELEADLARFRRIARSLDSQFEIAGIKFGWDAIAGLLPGVGDLATTAIGTYALVLARKHRLGRWTMLRLAGNLALDWGVGTLPLLGDLFDVVFKAHQRNLRVLEQAAGRRRTP